MYSDGSGKRKARSTSVREKKKLNYNYNMLVHEIIPRDSAFILIGEIYYPEYTTIEYTDFDYYGRPVIVRREIFEGYRYTNAVVTGLSYDGELLWDHSFEIRNIKSFNLRERVKVMFDGEDVVLMYSSNGSIASKIIRGSEVIEGIQYSRMESAYENDKLLQDIDSDIVQWYDNYFVSYGYQGIKNNIQLKRKERKVFYITKVKFG